MTLPNDQAPAVAGQEVGTLPAEPKEGSATVLVSFHAMGVLVATVEVLAARHFAADRGQWEPEPQ